MAVFISRQAEIALLISAYLSQNLGTHFGTENLCKEIEQPLAFTAKIATNLQRHAIIKASRGYGGGLWMDSPNHPDGSPITALDVITIIDGEPLGNGNQLSGPLQQLQRRGRQAIQDAWNIPLTELPPKA